MNNLAMIRNFFQLHPQAVAADLKMTTDELHAFETGQTQPTSSQSQTNPIQVGYY